MYQRRVTCFLVIIVVVVLLPPLLASYPCVAAAHGPPRHAPGIYIMNRCVCRYDTVMMLGGDTGAWGQTDGMHRQGRNAPRIGAARRLGQRIPLKIPPSPIPNEDSGVVIPLMPPPPPITNE
ncbi:hypothetical protein ZWY2020_023258 [Hordeum vulgare]|nr:hypothetical protein ZWY2020_023258 [Hordeum vulgare]